MRAPTASLRPRFPHGPVPDSGRRMGGRDASARAQSRQLSAGRLRAARRTPASWTSSTGDSDDQARRARGAHRRPHRSAPDRVHRIRRARPRVFVADLIPTTAHLQDPWVMGYDLFPMETLAFKKRFIREAIDREYLIFFEHDPQVAAGYIREKRMASDTSSRCSVSRDQRPENRRLDLDTHGTSSDRHHRRQRPVRHGRGHRPHRGHAHDAVRRSVRALRARHAARQARRVSGASRRRASAARRRS